VNVSAKAKRLSAKLPPNFALLTISSEPPGLAVTLDGKSLGVTPVVDKRVDAKAHDRTPTAKEYARASLPIVSQSYVAIVRGAPLKERGKLNCGLLRRAGTNRSLQRSWADYFSWQ
jgi:hypothetical protein